MLQLEILTTLLRGVGASLAAQNEKSYLIARTRFDETLALIPQAGPLAEDTVEPCTVDSADEDIGDSQGQGDRQLEATVWLLKANAAARAGIFEEAESWYGRASALDCSYARPYLGLAALKIRLALQEPPAGTTLANDQEYRRRYAQLLEEAHHYFTLACEATHRPEQALFAERLNYAQGEWHLAHALLPAVDVNVDLEAAARYYSSVIAGFAEAPPERQRSQVLRALTASALANRGLAMWGLGRLQESLRDYTDALELEGERNADRAGRWWQKVAEIHLLLGECGKGRSALGEAQRLRPDGEYEDLLGQFADTCSDMLPESSASARLYLEEAQVD